MPERYRTKADSFHAGQRILMGPGPSDVPSRVLQAMARPTLGHLDPQFAGMMDDLKGLLRYAFMTANPMTFPVSGPGSAGMESCFVNLVEPGDTVVVCRNGVFGGRMKENVERCGATAVMVDSPWGEPVDPAAVASALEQHPQASLVAFIHAETSTGVESDAAEIARIARDHDCLTLMDAVTSVAGIPVLIDDWQIDAVYSGSQKCLSCTPGLSPVSFSERAIERVKNRRTPVQSWFLDLNLVLGYWSSEGGRSYHHTAPVNALYALHEALVILHEEGLEAAWRRHRTMHEALRAGLEAMGLELPVAPAHRLPQLNAVRVPDGVNEAEVRRRLLEDYSIEIGAGLGEFAGRVWRIGLMGASARPRNVLQCLGALDTILSDLGAAVNTGVAVAAAREALATPAAA
ncbi:MAG: alanine--glyoxylate aminotransferase family protein [Gammaproteobacteria bacterium]|nr:alanine--glyoxylate aminotransferase family protein [Gammaproteobacteria bacterium]